MSIYRMTLPDVGERVTGAELVEWPVAIGDEVTPLNAHYDHDDETPALMFTDR